MTLSPGACLGPYQITSALGAGAMGAVYRARDPRLGRDVAIKVLAAGALADAAAAERFDQEAKAVGSLNHPNVVAVFDVGRDGDRHYVVTELLEGETLRKRLSGALLAERRALEYAIQIAHGMGAAHDKRIVHRDLKPENLFVTRDGFVKILDFGLAKRAPGVLAAHEPTGSLHEGAALTDPGMVIGTIGYMSPEQVQGHALDARSDIFSYGAVLYEMLAGRRAFQCDTPAQTMGAIVKSDPAELSRLRPDVTPGLERVVARCLEKRPEERFQSARDVAFALEALSAGGPKARPHVRPRRGQLVTVAAVVAAALGSYVVGRVTGPFRLPEFHRLSLHRGPIASARFRHDGRSVLYSAPGESGPPRVFAVDVDDAQPRRLDLSPGIVLGVSSRQEIALLLGPVAGVPGSLSRVGAEGTASPPSILHVLDATWALDGKLCVLRVVQGQQQLELATGEVLYRPTRPIQSPRFSPKGDRIAFSDGESIEVIDASGRNLVTLASRVSPVRGLAWSPRGDEVWFAAGEAGNRALRAVSLRGWQRLVYRLPGDTTLQDVSADGRVLLTHGLEQEGIVVLSPGADRERELGGYARPRVVALSADGGDLLVQEEEAQGGGPAPAVYLQRTDGSPRVRLGDGRALDLSPDGRRALVILPGSPSRLVALSTDGGMAVPLPLGNLDPVAGRWLAEGKALVLARRPGAELRPFLLGPSSEPAALSPVGFEAAEPSADDDPPVTVSPDGKVAAVVGAGSRILLVALDGGAPAQVLGLEAALPLRWSGDGRSLYVRETDAGRERVFRVDPASGTRELWRELVPSDPDGVTLVETVDLTPDGRSYAYTYHRQLLDLYLVDGLH